MTYHPYGAPPPYLPPSAPTKTRVPLIERLGAMTAMKLQKLT